MQDMIDLIEFISEIWINGFVFVASDWVMIYGIHFHIITLLFLGFNNNKLRWLHNYLFTIPDIIT